MEQDFLQKLKAVLASRKFWALIGSLVTIAAGYFTGGITPLDAVHSVVAAFGAYSLGVAIDK